MGLIAALLLSSGVALRAFAQAAAQTNDAKTAAETKPAPAPDPLSELKKQQEQLSIENGVAEQQLRKELAKLTAEKQKLELENALNQQKLQAENASMQAEIEKLTKQADLMNKQAALKDTERRIRLDAELADAREKMEKLRVANELAATEVATKMRELGQRDQELKVRMTELQVQRTEFDNQLSKLNADIDLREKRDMWKNRVNHDIEYTKEPFKDGVLIISDRRIAFNGLVSMELADHVAERIDYFNNQNQEYPIFIVIDNSPGGSVMAGYKILKAMAGSPAPVYVVVKSYAASMAAGVVTLAKKSFAYPNAIILHHQIAGTSYGNLTEQKEALKESEEWWKRLAGPVAAKMGIGLDEFIKKMYEKNSTGTWKEFADSAHKLKWVDEVVETVREESYVKNPDVTQGRSAQVPLPVEQTDANGRRYVLLPRLDPVDCYYLYNPDNFYRLAP
jgi:ATP-dependent Clp protease protease subunit